MSSRTQEAKQYTLQTLPLELQGESPGDAFYRVQRLKKVAERIPRWKKRASAHAWEKFIEAQLNARLIGEHQHVQWTPTQYQLLYKADAVSLTKPKNPKKQRNYSFAKGIAKAGEALVSLLVAGVLIFVLLAVLGALAVGGIMGISALIEGDNYQKAQDRIATDVLDDAVLKAREYYNREGDFRSITHKDLGLLPLSSKAQANPQANPHAGFITRSEEEIVICNAQITDEVFCAKYDGRLNIRTTTRSMYHADETLRVGDLAGKASFSEGGW